MFIENVFICDHAQYIKTNIRIKDNIIEDIGEHLVCGKEEKHIDLSKRNIVIMPSFYDLNVRLKDNIFNTKNIDKVLKKAKKSGVEHISIIPDSTPSISNELILDIVKKYPNVVPMCNSLDNDDLSPISTLLNKGARAIYLDSIDSNSTRIVCEYALIDKTPIFYKSYDRDISNGFMNNHMVASRMGIQGIDDIAQTSQVAKMVQIGEFFESKIVFNSVVSPKSIELIDESKKNNNFVIQTPIHHFILSDKECENFNTIAKIFPPLQDNAKKEKLIQALVDGKIDILTSMQAHEDKKKKDLSFEDASYGINEIDIYFAICYTYLVKTKIVSLQYLSKLLSANARKIFNQEPIIVDKNKSIKNFVFVDLDKEFVVNNRNSLYHKCNLSSQVVSLGSIS